MAPQLAQGRLNAVAPGFLIHVMDQISGWHFLVDTGAAFSIIPHSYSISASGRGIVGLTYQVLGGMPSGAEAVRPSFQMDLSSSRGPDGHLRD